MSENLDKSQVFDSEHLLADLGRRSMRAGIVTVSAQAVKFALNMGSTMVLARLLTPADFGLIAMVATFTGFVGLFKDLGLTMATIQRDKISHAQVSSLFWINVGLSIVIMAIAAVSAPAIAWFYGQPELTLVTITISVTFLFGGLGAQHFALLRRQMRFSALAVIEIGSLIGSITTAVIMAWYGARFWSLVAMGAARAFFECGLAWWFSGWVPGSTFKRSEVSQMLKYGGFLTGSNVLGYIGHNLDNILIGYFIGPQALGLYSKAYGLMMLPLNQLLPPVMAVANPALCRLNSSPDRFAGAAISLFEKVSFISFWAVICLFFAADWVVLILLGPGWEEAVPIFRILALFAFVEPVACVAAALLTASGKADALFRWKIFSLAIVVSGFIAGLPWGAVGLATSYALSGLLIRTPLFLWFVGRSTVVATKDILRTISPGFVSGIITFTALAGLRTQLDTVSPVFGIGIVLASSSSVYLCCLAAVPSGRRQIKEMAGLVAGSFREKPF